MLQISVYLLSFYMHDELVPGHISRRYAIPETNMLVYLPISISLLVGQCTYTQCRERQKDA